MEAFMWAGIGEWVSILAIMLMALLLPEPAYIDYMRGGAWTAEKSGAALNNKIIYARRFIRRGLAVGLVLGVPVFFVTWLIRGSLS